MQVQTRVNSWLVNYVLSVQVPKYRCKVSIAFNRASVMFHATFDGSHDKVEWDSPNSKNWRGERRTLNWGESADCSSAGDHYCTLFLRYSFLEIKAESDREKNPTEISISNFIQFPLIAFGRSSLSPPLDFPSRTKNSIALSPILPAAVNSRALLTRAK